MCTICSLDPSQHTHACNPKPSTPLTGIITAMELQAEAERRKRASILESEGQRQAVINVAEGSKQEVRRVQGPSFRGWGSSGLRGMGRLALGFVCSKHKITIERCRRLHICKRPQQFAWLSPTLVRFGSLGLSCSSLCLVPILLCCACR